VLRGSAGVPVTTRLVAMVAKRNLGHLRWRSYNYSQATATGVEWAGFGREPIQQRPLRIDATIRLHFYDVQDGTFRKCIVVAHYNRHVFLKRLIGRTRTYRFTYVSIGN
jgi:hypothetical protein